jgi:peptidoglycan/LPS O-acetylase OafA/YrhL
VNAWWSYFWPAFAAGLMVGAIAGSIGFRRRSKRNIALAAGLAASMALAAFWHGPLGAATRFSQQVERSARQILNDYEMTQVAAHLHRNPLTRRLILSGPADDFQRSELVRITGALPGVSSARWSGEKGGPPLIAEGSAVAVLGFLFGLLLAYLVELRRRYNAQWNW